MVKEILQNVGSSWAVGLEGDSQIEIEQMYYSYFNYGATSGELIVMNDGKFAYFWSDLERILMALESSELAKLLNKGGIKGKKGGMIEEARKNAEKRFYAMPQETFLRTDLVSGKLYAVASFERDSEE